MSAENFTTRLTHAAQEIIHCQNREQVHTIFSDSLQANLEKCCRDIRALRVDSESCLKCVIQSININMFILVEHILGRLAVTWFCSRAVHI